MTEQETKRDKASARRRRVILDAAMKCFIDHGYHQTGVRDIAKSAGVSLGNLYNHFQGKHEVLVEIAALELKELTPFLNILGKPNRPSKILDQFISAYGTYLGKPENVILTIELSSEAVRKPDIGELFVANRDKLIGALASVIERGIDQGEFRENLKPYETAQIIIDLIDAGAYRAVLNEARISRILTGIKKFTTAAIKY